MQEDVPGKQFNVISFEISLPIQRGNRENFGTQSCKL